ncbi:Putative E3 ubiquitin-protein ligase LIN-1 [Linum perenne]
MADFDTLPINGGGWAPPPKDFVCPITTNIFSDPVTLETGQTYERQAIQEWLDRGNTTCPITRQKLSGTLLPKTNYVLKRLIASWLENNPASNLPETPPRRKISDPPTLNNSTSSPNSVIAAAAVDCSIGELRHAINNLCMSEILDESEVAVLRIERFWQEGKNLGFDVESMLARPAVVSGFVEILFNSVDPTVLRATVFLLSELGSRDKSVAQTLTRVDSDVDCIVALFNKGLLEAVVLIYLLRPSPGNLMEMEMVDSLLAVLKRKESDMLNMCMKPRSAAILLLGQMLGNNSDQNVIIKSVVKADVVESIVGSLESEWTEERISAVRVLLKCMQEDGKCRNTVADKAELANVLESFVGCNDAERFEIISFLSELVKLNRRTFNEQVLHIIKDEGTFSTMHTFLHYLQTAPLDQSPLLAALLFQLDLLAEPRKMSMYREEAMDTLISCLRNSDFPAAQIAAANAIVSLPGRFTASGKSLTRAFLLKRAGVDKSFRNLVQMDKSGNLSGETQEEFLIVEGLQDLNKYIVDVKKGLRELRKSCPLAFEILKLLSEGRDNSAELWNHKELVQVDCCENGEVRSIAYFKDKIISGHSDGTMKVWTGRGSILHLIQEIREHTKAVSSLVVHQSGDKLYSGSLDKTTRVWSIVGDKLNCVQVHDMKEQVHNLVVANSISCFIPAGAGIKVHSWSGRSKLLNSGRYVKCLSLVQGKLYCGCHDNSIQEIDLATETVSYIQNGSRKLIGKVSPVYAMEVRDGLVYSAVSPLDEAPVKIWNASNHRLVGSLSTTMDVRTMTISSELIYLGGKVGTIEIWDRKKHNRIEIIQACSTSRVLSMALDSNEEILVAGTSDGWIQAWGLT